MGYTLLMKKRRPEIVQKIIILDDERAILNSLIRELRELNFDIHAFTKPDEALEKMLSIMPDVFISDVRMPNMSGIEVLHVVAGKLPNTERILLTGYSDIEATVSAINRGHVHYYLQKPWDSSQLISVVTRGAEFSRLRSETFKLQQLTEKQNQELEKWNQELEALVQTRTSELKEAYDAVVSSFSSMVEKRMRWDRMNYRYVTEFALAIGSGMGLSEQALQNLKSAVLLQDIGKISFSDTLLDTPLYELSKEQREIYNQHPILAALTLTGIKPLLGAATILSCVGEQPNGQGYPNCLKGNDIPLESMILRYAVDFFAAINGRLWRRSLSETEALAWTEENKNRVYHPEVVDVARSVLLGSADKKLLSGLEFCVGIHGVQAGMTLSRDLRNEQGLLLLPEGTRLEKAHIHHLVQLDSNTKTPLVLYVFE